VTIGRDAASDIVLADDPRASRRHAELRLGSDGSWILKDVGSHNGTFLNGERISQAFLSDGDIVALGNHLYRFRQGKLEEFSATDDTSLDVARLKVVTEGGTTLLDDVAFSLPSRSVLAIVGPSGAGKTTLLRALNGFSAPTEGGVRFAGRDLYGAYDELRSRIGYVPQDDLVHPQLTIRQELDSAAALRLPPDLGKQGRGARVDRVIDELGLAQRADLRIDKLSGGQRKRASLAIELLTEPALLFLDEPTSGLDPGNEHQVMSVLRELADKGRIVIVVTHATQSLSLVDRVLFLTRGGQVAYYGPPDRALAYFARHGITGGYAEIFRVLEAPEVDDLAARFRSDPDHDRFVDRALRQADVALWVTHGGRARPMSPVRPVRQLSVLVRRQLRILRGDKRTLALLAVQAPLFGLIIALLFPAHTMSTTEGPFAALLLWLLVVSATWLGASNSIREIVKELPLYRRERAVGLSISAYLGSKALVFGTITVIQSVVLVLIGFSRQSLPPRDTFNIIPLVQQSFPGLLSGLRPLAVGSLLNSQMTEILIAVALAGLAGMALGLAVSARVQRSDQAVLSLPIVLVVQMTLSLPLLQAQNPSPFLKVLGDLTGANWGRKAVASTTSLNQLMTSYLDSLTIGNAEIRQLVGKPYPTPYIREQLMNAAVGTSSWRHAAEPWIFAIFVLLLMMLVFFAAAWYFLRRIDVGRRRHMAVAHR
jgi:ABC-type multidrug transport system ATPase subunit